MSASDLSRAIYGIMHHSPTTIKGPHTTRSRFTSGDSALVISLSSSHGSFAARRGFRLALGFVDDIAELDSFGPLALAALADLEGLPLGREHSQFSQLYISYSSPESAGQVGFEGASRGQRNSQVVTSSTASSYCHRRPPCACGP